MKVSIETYGCATNQADGEHIAGLLEAHGFSVGEDGEVILVNTCTVKSPTENKIRKRLGGLSSEGRRVVVSGCLPAANQSIVDDYLDFSFIGVNSGDAVAAVEAVSKGFRYVKISVAGDKICLPKIRANPYVEIIQLSEGCLGSCTYCITKKARGNLVSYPPKAIVGKVKEAVSDGVKEVWLTSQDNGAYGLDLATNLAKLLDKVVEVSGDFKVRVGMANPNHVLANLDELVNAFKDDKVYKFLHVPVQSGSDKILSDMGRKYSITDYNYVVEAFRRAYDTTISTDVIAGYPTESEEDFQETVKLIRKVSPDVLNVSRFWPRPGTKAAGISGLPGRETKRRSRILNELFKEVGFEQNRKWVGWEGEALASQKNADGTYTARNNHYKPIVIESEKDVLGKNIQVKVEKATYFDLRGVIA
ncbi:MAG: tRNA (N(6)-L-threonylcarbamoyladenosine(37)-C(2))-methylthiotransferase [Methanobacteriota archaeon]